MHNKIYLFPLKYKSIKTTIWPVEKIEKIFLCNVLTLFDLFIQKQGKDRLLKKYCWFNLKK